jgi:hypothetical protein
MKKSYPLFVAMLLISLFAQAQYPIGHQSLTYTDPARANRSITTETYYPATYAGESTPFATGQFPLIVFGHGFVMGYDAYAYFKTAMVPLGYIVVFATTETGTSPVHADFGADLAFLINKVKSEGANSSSPFYNKVATTSAIMGHSMGGGSSFLACANNTVPTCMVTFAAANTSNPTSISVADQVTIPAFVISGADDCVAPPATHQIPMYDSLASACKVYMSILDGSHCYFGDYNFACTFGESTCNPTPTLARADQQDVTLDFVKLYLDYYLKGNAASWNKFNDSLNISPRITHQISCPTTGINEINNSAVSVWPNPVNNELNISFIAEGAYSIRITDITGKVLLMKEKSFATGTNTETIETSDLPKGIYFIELQSAQMSLFKKFIKI